MKVLLYIAIGLRGGVQFVGQLLQRRGPLRLAAPDGAIGGLQLAAGGVGGIMSRGVLGRASPFASRPAALS